MWDKQEVYGVSRQDIPQPQAIVNVYSIEGFKKVE